MEPEQTNAPSVNDMDGHMFQFFVFMHQSQCLGGPSTTCFEGGHKYNRLCLVILRAVWSEPKNVFVLAFWCPYVVTLTACERKAVQVRGTYMGKWLTIAD